ncbi:hypothetical protein ACET3Z_031440 [Daucus carota]
MTEISSYDCHDIKNQVYTIHHVTHMHGFDISFPAFRKWACIFVGRFSIWSSNLLRLVHQCRNILHAHHFKLKDTKMVLLQPFDRRGGSQIPTDLRLRRRLHIRSLQELLASTLRVGPHDGFQGSAYLLRILQGLLACNKVTAVKVTYEEL